ncbi:UNVERIFIED_CONTAM: hypothetical protein FKN15_049635 [Acipenser sinensis]
MGVTVKGPLAVSAGQEEGAYPGTGLGEGQGEGVKHNTYTENTTPSQGTPDCFSTERTGLQTEETWYIEKVLNGDSGTLEHSISTALREDPSDQESDSWDTLFNDEGDCLDPHLLEEISQDQGKVKKSIQEPRFDYYNWAVESEVELRDDELSHIDLQVPFRVQNRGSAPNFQQLPVARDALRTKHPMLKVRPLSQASAATKAKSRGCSDYLLPAKERPKTSVALARRLVIGALGVRSPQSREDRDAEKRKLQEARDYLLPAKERPKTSVALARRLVIGALGVRSPQSREDRDAEKRKLQEAREQKRLVTKQREDAWEGK